MDTLRKGVGDPFMAFNIYRFLERKLVESNPTSYFAIYLSLREKKLDFLCFAHL